jgi:hypothetical protein
VIKNWEDILYIHTSNKLKLKKMGFPPTLQENKQCKVIRNNPSDDHEPDYMWGQDTRMGEEKRQDGC